MNYRQHVEFSVHRILLLYLDIIIRSLHSFMHQIGIRKNEQKSIFFQGIAFLGAWTSHVSLCSFRHGPPKAFICPVFRFPTFTNLQPGRYHLTTLMWRHNTVILFFLPVDAVTGGLGSIRITWRGRRRRIWGRAETKVDNGRAKKTTLWDWDGERVGCLVRGRPSISA
jgi:hypothetical protein